MNTYFIKSFKKNFLKRVIPFKTIEKQFQQRRKLFIKNRNDVLLHDHALSGKMKGFRSFSVTGDIRVIYYMYEGDAYFINIGSHNQVY